MSIIVDIIVIILSYIASTITNIYTWYSIRHRDLLYLFFICGMNLVLYLTSVLKLHLGICLASTSGCMQGKGTLCYFVTMIRLFCFLKRNNTQAREPLSSDMGLGLAGLDLDIDVYPRRAEIQSRWRDYSTRIHSHAYLDGTVSHFYFITLRVWAETLSMKRHW